MLRAVVREARALGLAAPINTLLLELVGLLQATEARLVPQPALVNGS